MKNFGKYFLAGLLAFSVFGVFGSTGVFAQKGGEISQNRLR